jgi:IclR family transcriptional regulator, pca regulon regulatory protein
MPRLNAKDAAERAARSPEGFSRQDFSEALARGLRILACFDSEHRRMTLSEAARAAGFPRATVRRTLNTLVHLGYMTLDGHNYELTPRVLALASAYLAAGPGSALLQPACERLCKQLGNVCSVAVLDGPDAVMIARAAPNQLLAAGVGVGHRLPAADTSLGRVLLAALEEGELERRLDASGPEAPRLRDIVRAARRDGYAYADSEHTPDFRSIAVPLLRWDGAVIAAINVGGRDLDAASLQGRILTTLRHTAQELRALIV